MALPKDMRLKGHRTFNYIYKNATTYHGKLMTFKVARSNPEILLTHKFANTSNKFRVAIAISKKVSKKAVERNKLKIHKVKVFASKDKLSKKNQLAWKIAEIASDNAKLNKDSVDMVINRMIDNASVAIASLNRKAVITSREINKIIKIIFVLKYGIWIFKNVLILE